jgi:FkbH-like protein
LYDKILKLMLNKITNKKILVLRNFTVEPILNELEDKFLKKNIKCKFDISTYDSSIAEILKIKKEKIIQYDCVIVLFSFETFLQQLKNSGEALKNFKKLIFDLIQILAEKKFKNVNLFYFFSNELIKLSSKKNSFINNTLDEISKIKKKNINIFNLIKEINLFDNKKKFFDSNYWKTSLFPFNGEGQKLLGTIIYLKLKNIFNLDFKLIILDADNTLWNGIIDENGYKKINFINTNKEINYLKFHKNLKKLISYGHILALSTKNDLKLIKKTFLFHGKKKILTTKDFAIIKANWDPKYLNINSILKYLNLSIDNAVFIDDSDFEINSINKLLPRLETFNFYKYKYFHSNLDKILMNKNINITIEDKQRTKLYIDEDGRKNEKKKFQNYNEYIKNLKISLIIKKNSKKNVQRLSQLTLRTNQFNSTTLRIDEKSIKKILKDKKKIVYECSATDRFGDYGIIALAIVNLTRETALMTNILMSCRALGREIENYFANYIVLDLKKNYKIDNLEILFKGNEKNNLIKKFLNKNFKKLSKTGNYYYSYQSKLINNKYKLMQIHEK